jgi:hypothetical protein
LAATPEILFPYSDAARRVSLDAAELDRVERRLAALATALDSAFAVPGTRIRFGADSLIGLVPGIGDAIGLALSGYLILEARRLGAPPELLTRMAANVAVDAAVGAIPFLGDAFDVFFKANKRNMAHLRNHIADLRSRHARVVSGGEPHGRTR